MPLDAVGGHFMNECTEVAEKLGAGWAAQTKKGRQVSYDTPDGYQVTVAWSNDCITVASIYQLDEFPPTARTHLGLRNFDRSAQHLDDIDALVVDIRAALKACAGRVSRVAEILNMVSNPLPASPKYDELHNRNYLRNALADEIRHLVVREPAQAAVKLRAMAIEITNLHHALTARDLRFDHDREWWLTYRAALTGLSAMALNYDHLHMQSTQIADCAHGPREIPDTRADK